MEPVFIRIYYLYLFIRIYYLYLFIRGAPLRRTPSGPTVSIIERVSSGQGFIIHFVGYIWDSVSVHYRGMRVSSKRGSTVYLPLIL